MSESKREELLDETLVNLRKILKAAQGKTYKPSNMEIFRIEQINDVITAIRDIDITYKK